MELELVRTRQDEEGQRTVSLETVSGTLFEMMLSVGSGQQLYLSHQIIALVSA